MNGSWNLDRLYTGFTSPEYSRDMEQLKTLLKQVGDFAQQELEGKGPATQKTVRQYLMLTEDFQILYSGLYAYAFFRESVDVEDKEAFHYEAELEGMSATMKESNSVLGSYMKNIRNMQVFCEGDCFLQPYAFYLEKIAKDSSHLATKEQEQVILAMSRTGSKAWSRLQAKVSSQAMVTIHEEGAVQHIPIGQFPSLPKTNSLEIRESRFWAELKAYENYQQYSAMALNHIKGEALATSALRGFSSPLDQMLHSCHMERDVLTCMMDSIYRYLPKLCRYYQIKGAALGYQKGLPYYERETSITEDQKRYTYEEGRWMILRAFASFSPHMYRFGKCAFDGEWIDYKAADGKQGGASCDGSYAIKESRIRMIYHGSFTDVNTLAHELGHGYHNHHLFQEGVLNYSYDLPIAETASKFSEILLKEEWKKELPVAETIYIDDFILSGFINTIADIQSRFYFEDQLFKRRSKGELSADEICGLMLEAQKNSYGDSLDPRLLHPYMWLNKPHYYFHNRHYYNFPYSFGTLLSIGLYRLYLEDKKQFVKHYGDFLSATGKMDVSSLCQQMGIDVKQSAFWDSSLDYIVKLLEQFQKNLHAGER